MQSVEITGLRELARKLEQFPDELDKMKSDFWDEAGQEMLYAVQQRIGGSGRIAAVQDYYKGSHNGYVAVRAMAKTFLGGYAVGYITNSLENGHVQEKGRYVPAIGVRLKKKSVDGKYMYHDTKAIERARIVREGAKYFEKKATAFLEGKE